MKAIRIFMGILSISLLWLTGGVGRVQSWSGSGGQTRPVLPQTKLNDEGVATGPWYVATSGNDSNDCLAPATPCATINAAIGKASPGDTINIAEGTYIGMGNEVVRIEKDITLSGGWDDGFTSQSLTTIIDGRGFQHGVSVVGMVTVTIDRLTIQRGLGRYDESGGAIYMWDATLTVNNSVLRDNTSDLGAGIFVGQGNLTLNSTDVTRNQGTAIMNYGGNVMINNSSVSDNYGDFGGGFWNAGTLAINNSTISNNHIRHEAGIGGGIYNEFGILTLNSSTVISNTSMVDGGGIYNRGNVTIQNTIISGNTSGSSPDCYGTLTSAGYNLLGDPEGCTFTSGKGDLVGVNPDLGPLIGMQGIPKYHPLLSTSPAIDAGNPAGCSGSTGDLLTDQRGASRVGVCDIGAYEYTLPSAPSLVIAYSGTNQYAPPGNPFTQPLVASVLDSLGSPVDGITVTFSAPAAGSSGLFTDTTSNTTTAVTTSSSLAMAATFTANEVTGSYVVSASIYDSISLAQFSLNNATGDLYVSLTGDDTKSCLESTNPCATLLEAFNKADPGKTIHIVQGVYTDTAPDILHISKDIVVSGGWDETFSLQAGTSTLDGEEVRSGVTVDSGVSAMLDRVNIEHASSRVGYGPNGIYNDGVLTMTLVTIQEITGMGIINNSNLKMSSSIVQGNTEGGISNTGTINMYNSAVVENTAENATGGISNDGNGVLNINNSTIGFNSSRNGIGGIRNNGVLSLNSSTVSHNTGGGIQTSAGNQLALKNTIVAENVSKDNTNQDCDGNITSSGYNLVGNTNGCNIILGPGDLMDTDAALSPFSDPSGVQPILRYSPAIDAGDPNGCTDHEGNALDTDQRGVARVGRCDIGAYEYNPATDPISYISLPVAFQNLCSDFFDDFSDPSSGWYTGEDDEGRFEYINNEYSVVVKPADWYWLLSAPTCDRENYSVEVDARWAGKTGASYGLIFGIQGDIERFYSFEVNTDYQEYALFRYDSGSWTEIAPITFSAVIHPGSETNHLKATRNGAAITLEVNGTVLGTWSDSTITGASYAGLIVSSYSNVANADARFDNFSVSQLESSPNIPLSEPKSRAERVLSQMTPANADQMPAHVYWRAPRVAR